MPRYYFHFRTESAVEQDTVGVEFPTLDAAIADAHQARREYFRDQEIQGDREQRLCRFEIADQTGLLVATVPDADQ